MIQIINYNSLPYTFLEGNSYKSVGESFKNAIAVPESDICICDYVGCEYKESVFGSSTDDYWKNDSSSFLFKRFIAADVIALKLEKDGIEVADLNDDTLGTLYDGFPDGNSSQQLYYGFIVDWKTVLSVHGTGEYRLIADFTILGTSSTYESRYFTLMTYSDLAAEGTVRIETYQDGSILGNEIDYSGLNWYASIRINGYFGNPVPIHEEDNYETSEREKVQIKAKISREWTLQTKKISWEVVMDLIYNGLLANEILISNYQIKAESIFRRINVKTTEVEKSKTINNPNRIYSVKFVDKESIFEKRNF